jgi:hypothetical protein
VSLTGGRGRPVARSFRRLARMRGARPNLAGRDCSLDASGAEAMDDVRAQSHCIRKSIDIWHTVVCQTTRTRWLEALRSMPDLDTLVIHFSDYSIAVLTIT